MRAVDEKVRARMHELVDTLMDARENGVDIHATLGSNFIWAYLYEEGNAKPVDQTGMVDIVPDKLFDTAIDRVKGWVENA